MHQRNQGFIHWHRDTVFLAEFYDRTVDVINLAWALVFNIHTQARLIARCAVRSGDFAQDFSRFFSV